MVNKRLEENLKLLMHNMAEVNQSIFSSGDYSEFLSLCNNDISILSHLESNPCETAKHISVHLRLPKTTVNSAVSRLTKRGYITREQNPKDGREQLLTLTEAGRTVNIEHNRYEALFLDGLIKLFNPQDYDALADILERSTLCSITE